MEIVSTEEKDVCASTKDGAGLQNPISHVNDGNQGASIALNNIDPAIKEVGKFCMTTIKFVIHQCIIPTIV